MTKWLKNQDVSGRKDEKHSILFSKGNTFAFIVIITCIELLFFIGPNFYNFQPASVLVGMLGDLTNNERQQDNLPILKVNPLLSKAADLKVRDIVANNYFSHTSPDGLTPWYWLDQVGYKYNYAGENLAVNFSETADVTGAWMKSPTHRSNILKSNYTEMGSAVATGTYKGRESVFVVQIYANPVVSIDNNSNSLISVTTSTLKTISPSNIKIETGKVLGTTTQKTTTVVPESSPVVKVLNQETSSYLEKIFSSPGGSTNFILATILVFLILFLVINIFIKFSKFIVINGLILIVIVITLIILNIYFGGENTILKNSLEYIK